MATRKPLVIVSGEIAELPAGDTVTGASGGGSGGSGPTSLLGAFPGPTINQVGTLRYYPRNNISISSIFAWLSAPAINAVVAAIRINGVVAQTLTIPAGQSTVLVASTLTVLTTDFLTMDIVGGTGKDLTLRLDY